jgi:hypothetical protein
MERRRLVMGKMLAFVFGLGDLGLLALVVRPGSRGAVAEAGLVAAFAVVAALAWVVAFVTAVYRAVVRGREWGWVLALAALLWLPALPALVFGASGIFGIARRARGRKRKDGARRPGRGERATRATRLPDETRTLPPAEPALVASGARTGMREGAPA